MPRRKQKREVFEARVVYCRDNPFVQAFVEERIWDFNPYRVPETARDVMDAAISQFNLFDCFYLEIQAH